MKASEIINHDLTVDQTLKLLQCSRARLYELIGDGTLASYLIGPRGRRIRWESVKLLRNGGKV